MNSIIFATFVLGKFLFEDLCSYVPGGQNLPGFQGEGLIPSLMNVSIGHIPY